MCLFLPSAVLPRRLLRTSRKVCITGLILNLHRLEKARCSLLEVQDVGGHLRNTCFSLKLDSNLRTSNLPEWNYGRGQSIVVWRVFHAIACLMMFSVDVFTMRRVKIMKVFALWKQDDRMPARFCVCVSARVCVYV